MLDDRTIHRFVRMIQKKTVGHRLMMLVRQDVTASVELET